MPEKIQIVDENDHPIGSATRQDAWAKGLYYRLVQIIIEDENGDILLQKRSGKKPSYPHCWTSAASGHVDEGETYEAAAARELHEELGIVIDLEFVEKFLFQMTQGERTYNQFNGVFRGHLPRAKSVTFDPEDVIEVCWFTREELKEKIAAAPEDFTPAVVEAIERNYS